MLLFCPRHIAVGKNETLEPEIKPLNGQISEEVKPTPRSRALAFPRTRTPKHCGAVYALRERRGGEPPRTIPRRYTPISVSLINIQKSHQVLRHVPDQNRFDIASKFPIGIDWEPNRTIGLDRLKARPVIAEDYPLRYYRLYTISVLLAKWGRCPKKRQIILAIVYGFLWSTWKVRNDLIFKKVRATVESITDSVCTLVFGWVC
ncbi:hypothetical protein LXL04_010576 [Taraxacum kok-saghyz]